ncbi:MAG: hypothetical protein M3O09_12940 [Acidobacteriota bacterium]|nr:hypothetical protein [Acidobacteriota bacterium]
MNKNVVTTINSEIMTIEILQMMDEFTIGPVMITTHGLVMKTKPIVSI